ncbi:MAG: hypothetical protein ACI9S8_002574 [Chlamydiales bacterium]|jgi:hypothetical protein
METIEKEGEADIFDLKKLRLNWSKEKVLDKQSSLSEQNIQKTPPLLIREFKESLIWEFGVKSQFFFPFSKISKQSFKLLARKRPLLLWEI